jgi:type II secretory pathway component PulF
MSRWARVLADLLESGAPLGEALRGAGWASRTPLYHQQSQSLAQAVEAANANVLPAIHPAKVFFPPTVVHALNLAEGPARVRLLKRLALVYADRADHRLKGRLVALGPIGIVAVGLLVGYVLFALLAPMMSLLTSLSG